MIDFEIRSLVEDLKEFEIGGQLKNYITHAKFPNFKGLEKFAHIDFPFPFTALVGANGIGKSSVLHALYGMPEGKSTAKYWFSTAVDPISSSDSRAVRSPPRYVYGHWHDGYGGIVETRKARVYSRARSYEYWEPTKISKLDGMQDMPDKKYARKSADRWNPVIREVIYINLKFAIGAFDRTFNFGKVDGDAQTEKHAEMRWGANKLRRVIDQNLTTWKLGGGRERVFDNRLLNEDELKTISGILGRPYSSARIIRHSLYPQQRGGDLSVIFERGRYYSEAFAGSGEVAVVSTVVQVLDAPKYALILLDEPETSLHPGAQKELLKFLLEQIKIKQLQIVISTHAIDFIDGLPDNAIKVFEDNGQGQTKIINESSPYIALHRLGRIPEKKILILVEDAMAKVLVDRAAGNLHEGERDVLDIRICPGGAGAILADQIPSMLQANVQTFAYLDGDQKRVDHFSKRNKIAPENYPDLPEIIKIETGSKPKFRKDGGNDRAGIADKETQNLLKYLDWMNIGLGYLPKICPDAVIYECMTKLKVDFKNSNEAKQALRKEIGINQSAEAAVGAATYALSKVKQNDDIDEITQTLRKWLAIR